jgi:hypothetical protein
MGVLASLFASWVARYSARDNKHMVPLSRFAKDCEGGICHARRYSYYGGYGRRARTDLTERPTCLTPLWTVT